MSVYHQMGHDSINLVKEKYLDRYKGVILSPVNCTPQKIRNFIDQDCCQNKEVIFDPQLYYPKSQRGSLPNWEYFPSDLDSIDLGNLKFWANLGKTLKREIKELGIENICSPALVPRMYSESYYYEQKRYFDIFNDELSQKKVYTTLIVNLKQLTEPDYPNLIASIFSGNTIKRIYLIVVAEIKPRNEIKEIAEIRALIKLIKLFVNAKIEILMGYCSSEILLTKSAGLHHAATGKFFNLRRFTSSRWDDPTGGGGQLPYLFEESLLAFIRSSDIDRTRQHMELSETTSRNPYAAMIMEQKVSEPQKPWLSLSWKQWLYYFMDIEERLTQKPGLAEELVKTAIENWKNLDDLEVDMEEELHNDGAWLKGWKRVLNKL